MIYFLIFFIGAVIGAIVGFAVAAVLAAGSNSDDLQEAYNKDFKNGRNSVLTEVNNLQNKYKNMADEYNN